jgi:serine/threonine protein kinase
LASVQYFHNGRLAVLKRLGEGGKGIVFKARDTALNRVVAIKMLKSAVASEGAHSRFMTEAQAVAKLNHPNIVSIHDIGKNMTTLCLSKRQLFALRLGSTRFRRCHWRILRSYVYSLISFLCLTLHVPPAF